MKKEDLFDTLGDINNQYIKEAHMNNKRKNNFAWVKWGTIAACFALLVLCIPIPSLYATYLEKAVFPTPLSP